MSFNYVKYRDESVNGIVEFICDTEQDIASLPVNKNIVAPGSKATVIETGNEYILNTALTWTLFNSGGGGSSGLPEDFPSEEVANANKLLGFDANGDYAALDNPIFKVIYSVSDDGGSVIVTCENTDYDGIQAAISAGKFVYATIQGTYLYLYDTNTTDIYFTNFAAIGSVQQITLTHANDNTITLE